MIDLEHFQKLEREVKDSELKVARLEGFLEQAKQRLKEEFGCSNLREAEITLDAYQNQLADMTKRYQKAIERYQKKYAAACAETETGSSAH